MKLSEDKPPLLNHQCIVYHFQCDLCDAGYLIYMCWHLHQQIDEHKGSTVRNHFREHHDGPDDIAPSLKILQKCQNKLDCLIFEMFFTKELSPTLNSVMDTVLTMLQYALFMSEFMPTQSCPCPKCSSRLHHYNVCCHNYSYEKSVINEYRVCVHKVILTSISCCASYWASDFMSWYSLLPQSKYAKVFIQQFLPKIKFILESHWQYIFWVCFFAIPYFWNT